MQADALAGLLAHLDMTPAVIAGGSGGARVSLLTAARHPETAAGLAIWWISGGVYGLLSLATHYCGGSVGGGVDARDGGGGRSARMGGGAGAEPLQPGPLPGAGPRPTFIADDGALDAGLLPARRRARARACPTPTPGPSRFPALVFRSGESDPHHTRATSEALADLLPQSPPRRAAVGRPGVDRAPGRPGGGAVRPLAPAWPPSSWSGRPTFSADRPISAGRCSGGRRPFSADGSRLLLHRSRRPLVERGDHRASRSGSSG